MSFLLVRLLQNFSSVSLELDAFSPGTLPPDDFKLASGRKGIEKVWPMTELTMYLVVRCRASFMFLLVRLTGRILGWIIGEDARSHQCIMPSRYTTNARRGIVTFFS